MTAFIKKSMDFYLREGYSRSEAYRHAEADRQWWIEVFTRACEALDAEKAQIRSQHIGTD